MASTRPTPQYKTTKQADWNGRVVINGTADPRVVERALRRDFPSKDIVVERNPNHREW